MSIPDPAANSNGCCNVLSPSPLSNGWPVSWIADDPDAANTSPKAVYQAAQQYVASGLSVVPIDSFDGDKSPDPRRLRSWKIYQLRKPRPDELQAWYEHGGPFGLAVIGGGVSGREKGIGLEIIDFDSYPLSVPWSEHVEARVPGLISRLVRVKTPRPGAHFFYRCREWAESQKLASEAAVDGQGRISKVTTIETRGEGAYVVTSPSPRRCHMSNRLYRLVDGSPPLTEVPIISPAERNILLEEARAFNRCAEPEPKVVRHLPSVRKSDGNRPGDDFERRVSWADILVPHGWVLVGRRGEIEDWRRPGKDFGISGTSNYANSGLFYAFTTNGYPFEEGRGYSKFNAYVTLNHHGDFNKAARALQEEGYGLKTLPAGKRMVSGGVQTITFGNR